MMELNWCPRNNTFGEYLKLTEIALLNGLKHKSCRATPRIPPSSWTPMIKSGCVLFLVLGKNDTTPTENHNVNVIFKIFETKNSDWGKLLLFASALKWLPRKSMACHSSRDRVCSCTVEVACDATLPFELINQVFNYWSTVSEGSQYLMFQGLINISCDP